MTSTSSFKRAALVLAVTTLLAITCSVAIIAVADLVLPTFTARFDNYALGLGIPLAVSPTLIYPLVVLHYRAEKAQAELEHLARTDPLTGLANRRAFFEYADKLFGEPRTPSTGSLALMMIDVDHFKRVNDIHGHAAGDELLKRIGLVVCDAVSGGRESTSLVARIGGEEFAVLLAGVDAAEASAVAERVCQSVRDESVLVGGELITATVSVGVAVRLSAETPDATLRAADKAVYDAKQSGRDRWSLAMSRVPAPANAAAKADIPLARRQAAVRAA